MEEEELLRKQSTLNKEVKSLRKKLKKTKRELGIVKILANEEEEGEGNWLVAYADMMTLLFGFFVILSAFSTPNAEKIEQIRKETSESMGGKYVKPFEDLSYGLAERLKQIKLEKAVSIIETAEGVTLTSQGALFFDSGSSDLKPIAKILMDNVSEVIAEKAKNFKVTVEGHTDNIPISSREFPSNWELSAARASTVVRLLENKGMGRDKLRPIGLADTEPVAPNTSKSGAPLPDNQAKNRRIVIKIIKKIPNRM